MGEKKKGGGKKIKKSSLVLALWLKKQGKNQSYIYQHLEF